MIASFFKELELRSQKVLGTETESRADQGSADDGGRPILEPDDVVKGQMPVGTSRRKLGLQLVHQLLQEIQALVQQKGGHPALARASLTAESGGRRWIRGGAVEAGTCLEGTTQLYNKLHLLSHPALTQLVLARLRPATLTRSPLAQQVSQMIL